MNPRILLVDDDVGTRFGFVRYLSKEGYAISEAGDLGEARDAIAKKRFDAVILDVNLPDGNGIDFIESVRASDLAIPIIVITGAGDIPLAVDAMRRGADNFLTKPVDIAGLSVFLKKSLEIGLLKRRQVAKQRLETQEEVFFGDCPAMHEIANLAHIAATNDSPLLITGETGTGKGMLAKWIHRHGTRSQNEFVEVNCSSLRGELLSREIFGNVRGAYTSADQDRKGLLDIADRGTLFLDEIGDMGMDLQAQFLKVLEDKSYRRVGDTKLLRSDFRLICATNRDIETMEQKGQFRQDLMYRINMMVIHVTPLRERREDLPLLAAHLLRTLGALETVLADDVMAILKSYNWPGNIREFKNILERALLLSHGSPLRPAHFSSLTKHPRAAKADRPHTVQELEESHIITVLEQMDGNIDKAAKSLNLSRATLYRRLKQIKEKTF
jgi:DNA-binding NtrC family response regulator